MKCQKKKMGQARGGPRNDRQGDRIRACRESRCETGKAGRRAEKDTRSDDPDLSSIETPRSRIVRTDRFPGAATAAITTGSPTPHGRFRTERRSLVIRETDRSPATDSASRSVPDFPPEKHDQEHLRAISHRLFLCPILDATIVRPTVIAMDSARWNPSAAPLASESLPIGFSGRRCRAVCRFRSTGR